MSDGSIESEASAFHIPCWYVQVAIVILLKCYVAESILESLLVLREGGEVG